MKYAESGMQPRSTRLQRTRWDTQDAAWESARGSVKNISRTILDHILKTPSTCDEVEVALGLTHQTASAAIHYLMRDGEIVATEKRPTRSGRSARVWKAKSPGMLF